MDYKNPDKSKVVASEISEAVVRLEQYSGNVRDRRFRRQPLASSSPLLQSRIYPETKFSRNEDFLKPLPGCSLYESRKTYYYDIYPRTSFGSDCCLPVSYDPVTRIQPLRASSDPLPYNYTSSDYSDKEDYTSGILKKKKEPPNSEKSTSIYQSGGVLVVQQFTGEHLNNRKVGEMNAKMIQDLQKSGKNVQFDVKKDEHLVASFGSEESTLKNREQQPSSLSTNESLSYQLPLGSPSSTTSNRKLLEWDSAADVGYQNQESTDKLSTIERDIIDAIKSDNKKPREESCPKTRDFCVGVNTLDENWPILKLTNSDHSDPTSISSSNNKKKKKTRKKSESDWSEAELKVEEIFVDHSYNRPISVSSGSNVTILEPKNVEDKAVQTSIEVLESKATQVTHDRRTKQTQSSGETRSLPKHLDIHHSVFTGRENRTKSTQFFGEEAKSLPKMFHRLKLTPNSLRQHGEIVDREIVQQKYFDSQKVSAAVQCESSQPSFHEIGVQYSPKEWTDTVESQNSTQTVRSWVLTNSLVQHTGSFEYLPGDVYEQSNKNQSETSQLETTSSGEIPTKKPSDSEVEVAGSNNTVVVDESKSGSAWLLFANQNLNDGRKSSTSSDLRRSKENSDSTDTDISVKIKSFRCPKFRDKETLRLMIQEEIRRLVANGSLQLSKISNKSIGENLLKTIEKSLSSTTGSLSSGNSLRKVNKSIQNTLLSCKKCFKYPCICEKISKSDAEAQTSLKYLSKDIHTQMYRTNKRNAAIQKSKNDGVSEIFDKSFQISPEYLQKSVQITPESSDREISIEKVSKSVQMSPRNSPHQQSIRKESKSVQISPDYVQKSVQISPQSSDREILSGKDLQAAQKCSENLPKFYNRDMCTEKESKSAQISPEYAPKSVQISPKEIHTVEKVSKSVQIPLEDEKEKLVYIKKPKSFTNSSDCETLEDKEDKENLGIPYCTCHEEETGRLTVPGLCFCHKKNIEIFVSCVCGNLPRNWSRCPCCESFRSRLINPSTTSLNYYLQLEETEVSSSKDLSGSVDTKREVDVVRIKIPVRRMGKARKPLGTFYYENEGEKQVKKDLPEAWMDLLEKYANVVVESERKKQLRRERGEFLDFAREESMTQSERERKSSRSEKSSYRSLQDWLESNRPDFCNTAENRRKTIIEKAKEREKNHELRALKVAYGEQPKERKRIFTTAEIKRQTLRKCKQLSEVTKQKEERKKREEYRTNRLMAEIFAKKLQLKTLRGQVNHSNSFTVLTN